MGKTHLKMTVNGKEVELLTEPRQLLIHVLREELNLTAGGLLTYDQLMQNLDPPHADGGGGKRLSHTGLHSYVSPAHRGKRGIEIAVL